MTVSKYDKYICTELKKRHMLPGPTPEVRDKLAAEGKRMSMEHVLWIDDEVIPGAYYGESTWIWPSSYPNQVSFQELMRGPDGEKNPTPMFPHAHDFPELLSWWGTDPEHPEDTGSMGMIMGDETIPLEKSWVAYIPAGMTHMPTMGMGPNSRISAKPQCHWTSGPGVYTREKDHSDDEKSEQKTVPHNIPEPVKKDNYKNAKYFVYDTKPGQKRKDYMLPYDPKYVRPMAYIDETIIPDCEFGCETLWLLPGDKSKAGQKMMEAHTLPHGTSIVFNAMNYEDITDLCAEVELWIGGEKHTINKSFGAYIPPDMEQGPMIIRNITKQIFYMMSYPVGEGINKYRGGR